MIFVPATKHPPLFFLELDDLFPPKRLTTPCPIALDMLLSVEELALLYALPTAFTADVMPFTVALITVLVAFFSGGVRNGS